MVLSAKNRDPITQGSYPRATISHNSCSSEKNRHHLYGHHHNQFEKGTLSSLPPSSDIGDNFKKRQHFVHGRPTCGSSDNYLTYGGIPTNATKMNSSLFGGSYKETDMHGDSSEKSTGFLYGLHDSEVGRPVPRIMKEKGGLPPWMMDKTSAELRKREIQSLEIEEDLARSRLEKANRQTQYLMEQKKDLEMLQSYKPWGKPGGGAPRGVENDRTSTIRTRKIEQLLADNNQVLPFGKPGAGAPNRTDSGNVKTKLPSDTLIQLRAHRDGRPVDFIQVKNGDQVQYRTELDKLAEETRYRRHKEKEEDFQHDLETLNYDPFGRPGGGAPLIGEQGSPRAGLPLHFSNHMQELRAKEPKHPHAYSGSTGSNNPLLPRQDFIEVDTHQKIKRKDSDTELNQGFQFGLPGAGAPVRDQNGRVLAHGRQTLIKDRSGAIVKSPTKTYEAYYPFGRPGGGAPIRDNKGKVHAHVAGIVENEKLGKVALKGEEATEARKEYLDTLRRMKEEKETQKFKEKSDLLESASSTSEWLRRGIVGGPKYDPYTHEIKADPMMTSDVTRQRMNIQTQASEKSRIYHHELDEIVKDREKRRMQDSVQQREQSVEHAKTMERAWGRPGYGAPNAERKKAKMDMMPADHGLKWRDA